MSNTERNAERCAGIEDKLVEYLDGRAKPAERRAVEEHLTACSSCRNRAEEFRHHVRLTPRCARALPRSPPAAVSGAGCLRQGSHLQSQHWSPCRFGWLPYRGSPSM